MKKPIILLAKMQYETTFGFHLTGALHRSPKTDAVKPL